ncbi:MAG: hypothetical protein JWO59_401 [Chloroflexi bacterium]|nr:hypothetical protein [Chloroflexota bacterium]
MNTTIGLMLILIVLGLLRVRWERQSNIAMVFVVLAYLAYAYFSG